MSMMSSEPSGGLFAPSSLPRAAAALMAEIVADLRAAAQLPGRSFSIVSRSHSTLRGHFRAEVDALTCAIEDPIDGVIVAPAFFEGSATISCDGNTLVTGYRGTDVTIAAWDLRGW